MVDHRLVVGPDDIPLRILVLGIGVDRTGDTLLKKDVSGAFYKVYL